MPRHISSESTWYPNCHLKYSYLKIYIMCSHLWRFNLTRQKLQRVKIQFIITRVWRVETSYDPTILTKPMIYQDRITSRTQEREREISNTELLVHTLSPEGELLPPRHGDCRDDEDAHLWWFPPPSGCRNGLPISFSWLQRLVATELPI